MKHMKFTTKVLMLALVIVLTLVLASCGGLELKSFTIVRTSIKTDYYVGEALDITGIKAVAKYSDSDLDKEYTYDELTFSFEGNETAETITQTVGKKNIIVSFVDPNFNKTTVQTATIMITVAEDPNAPQHKNYTMDQTNVKTEYFVGETVDLSGLSVIENFKNSAHASQPVDSSLYTFKYDAGITAETLTSAPGKKNINVYVKDELVGTITITVKYPKKVSQTDNVAELTTVFEENDVLDFSALYITVTYDNGTTKTFTYDDLKFSEDLATLTSKVGERDVFASVADPYDATIVYEVRIPVKVEGEAITIVNKTVVTEGVTLSYFAYNTIDLTGLTILVTYSDETTDVIELADIVTFSPALDTVNKIVGTQTIRLIWEDVPTEFKQSVEIQVEIKENTVTSEVSGVETSYTQGDTVDFSGITVELTYADGTKKTLTYADLTLTGVENLTATAGEKLVTAAYVDPITGVRETLDIRITVKEPAKKIASFEKPQAIVDTYEGNKANAGTTNYGNVNFSGQFSNGNGIYVIGDDNKFIFMPQLKVFNPVNNLPGTEAYFWTEVTIYVYENNGYVELAPRATDNSDIIEYYDGLNNLMVTVDTYSQTYQFTDKAVGKQVKLSVLPDHTRYTSTNPVSPAVLEAKVVDAYNVYSAKDLCLFDNDPSSHSYNNTVTWETFKEANGYEGIHVNGLILHTDIHLTADDVPQEFFHVTTKDITYYSFETGVAVKTVPAGTRYLRDGSDLYRRIGNGTFLFEGNYFTLSTANFPIVPSPNVFGGPDSLTNVMGYGSDFSNSTLFRFGNGTEGGGKATFNNLAVIGNAGQDKIVDAASQGNLVSAGGLIFMKAWTSEVTCNNMIGNSHFIAYFTETNGTMNLNQVKFYDAYQTTLFMWDTSYINVTTSYFNGSGGPMVIMESVDAEQVMDVYSIPRLIVDDISVFETHLTGMEPWFAAVNAGAIVGKIQTLSAGLQQANLGSLMNAEGKMNIISALIADGTNAAEIVTNGWAQGVMLFGDDGLNRTFVEGEASALWYSILTHPAFSDPNVAAPFLTVINDGVATTIYIDANNIPRNAATNDVIGAAELLAFQASDTVILSQGGISVYFTLYQADGKAK